MHESHLASFLVNDDQHGLSTYLSFVSTLIWQAIILGMIVSYRKQIGVLLGRISKMKAFGFEFENGQLESKDAITPTKEVMEELEQADAAGFLPVQQIKRLVENSGVTEPDEHAIRTLKLLSNTNQQGWLVGTNRALFYLLDSTKTRSTGKVIQWRLRFKEASPIVVNEPSGYVGTVSIGKRKNWLYSARLHADAGQLKQDILGLMSPLNDGQAE